MVSTFETSAANDVISRAISVWGKDVAQSILGRVIESVDFANTHVKPPYPVNCLKIQIADLPELHPSGVPAPRLGGLHDRWRGFCLLMDEKAPAEVFDEIEEVVTFETSRVRVFQERILRKYYADNTERSEIDTCVEDGMVVNVVEDILEIDQRPRLKDYQSYTTEPHLIIEGIERRLAMGTGPSEGSEPINDLRFGSPEFTRPGYKIGHAIVRSAMAEYGMDFDQMVIQPPSFFSNHAITMVR